ncbi:hypothetical protein [Streptomyces sp. TE33382]
MKKPIRLARAQSKLSPRLREIKKYAEALADTAELAGIVIHADLDAVANEVTKSSAAGSARRCTA